MAKYFAIFVLILSLATFSLNAQETRVKVPNQNWGVGVQLETHDIYGGTLAYAINPDMHIGLNFGFYFDSGEKDLKSSTFLVFGPYFKYFLSEMRMRSFFPFIKAQFLVSTESISYKESSTQKTTRTTNTETKIMGIFGSEWFPISSLGIYGGIRVLELNLDPFKVILGVGYPMIGIEWFF
ncbi:MAG: hypothetical protein WHV60_01555 [Bacteroidota bacterium]